MLYLVEFDKGDMDRGDEADWTEIFQGPAFQWNYPHEPKIDPTFLEGIVAHAQQAKCVGLVIHEYRPRKYLAVAHARIARIGLDGWTEPQNGPFHLRVALDADGFVTEYTVTDDRQPGARPT